MRKFDKFLKDNDAKRVRADRKVQEEKKARDQKETEKLELLEVLKSLDGNRAKLKLEVESKGKFQRFLDSVCEDPSEYFESIENITMRYETLAAAHEDLRQRVDSAQKQQESENAEFMLYVKQSQNALLVKNSEIASNQQEVDSRRFTSTDLEAALYKNEIEAKEGTRSLGETKMAIQNIYSRCVRVRNKEVDTLEEYLDAIKQRVTDLQSIVVGIDGPITRQELQQATRMRASSGDDAGKAKSQPAETAAMARSEGKPAASGAGGAPGESASPGSIGGSSRFPGGRGSTFRGADAGGAGGSGQGSMGGSGLSCGPSSKTAAVIS